MGKPEYNVPRKEATQCANCNGVGFLYVPTEDDKDKAEREDCVMCGGRGVMYV